MLMTIVKIILKILGSALIISPLVLGSMGMYYQGFQHWGAWLAGVSIGIGVFLFLAMTNVPLTFFRPYGNILPTISIACLIVSFGALLLYFLPDWVGFIGGLVGPVAYQSILIKRRLAQHQEVV